MLNTKKLTEIIPLHVDHHTLNFLYEKILNDKNHGLISGLSLLKYLEINKNNLSERAINAACKAISIHDLPILKGLLDIVAKATKEEKKSFSKKDTFKTITFNNDPVSFLLLLADSLQEQGRSDVLEDAAELQKLYSSDNKIFVEVSFTGPRAGINYERKIEELNTLRRHLTSGGRFVLLITSIMEVKDGATETRSTKVAI